MNNDKIIYPPEYRGYGSRENVSVNIQRPYSQYLYTAGEDTFFDKVSLNQIMVRASEKYATRQADYIHELKFSFWKRLQFLFNPSLYE